MPRSVQSISYSAVGIAALVLFIHGQPAATPAEAPTANTSIPAAILAADAPRTAAAPVPGTSDRLPFGSLSVDLPPGDQAFPDGPGADLVNGNCLSCHSADMVLNQPLLSLPTWTEEVNKMRNTYRAPIEAGDVQGIANYLATTLGPH
ncbi:MAG TPA: hypothetical protein VE684_06395 [Crenalkalicoccus sp.]|jgi:mono/diheme cytochrome c family protein|nr:hypothetical protein [Crenalkalicoccus sp.]